MEADWAFEIGGDAPVIEALWAGFIDLRAEPEKAFALPECSELPGLANALLKLNSAHSPVWTSKTDVFIPDQVDPDELDAPHDQAFYFLACYIDVLMRSGQVWNFPFEADQSCRQLCDRLRALDLRCCRVDIVVRRALVAETNDLGTTIYITACGREVSEAKRRLSECLTALSDELLDTRPAQDASK
jgi:hypothetical protein